MSVILLLLPYNRSRLLIHSAYKQNSNPKKHRVNKCHFYYEESYYSDETNFAAGIVKIASTSCNPNARRFVRC